MTQEEIQRAKVIIEQFVRENREIFVHPQSMGDVSFLQRNLDERLADEFLEFGASGNYSASIYWAAESTLRGVVSPETSVVVQIERKEVIDTVAVLFS